MDFDLYSLTANERKLIDLLLHEEVVTDSDILQTVQGYSEGLSAAALREGTRMHTMAVRRLAKKLPSTYQIDRIRGHGFRLTVGN